MCPSGAKRDTIRQDSTTHPARCVLLLQISGQCLRSGFKADSATPQSPFVTKATAITKSHPDRDLLQRFLRGEASREEKAVAVRHLLAGCPECVTLTRPVWGIAGSLQEELEVLEAQAIRPRPNHENRCTSRAWRDES